MNAVPRSGQAKLRVFLVVSGVGQVIHVAEFDQPWIFDTAIFFVIGFWRKHRLGATGEVEAIAALRIAEARRAVLVLCAVKHDEFAVVEDDRGIERASGLPGGALGGEDWMVRKAVQRGKGGTRCCWGEEKESKPDSAEGQGTHSEVL